MMTRAVVADLLDEVVCRRFFGSPELRFEAGQVVLPRKAETIKPETVTERSTRGSDNER